MKTVSLVSAKVVAKAKVDATFAEITSECCNLGALGFAAVEVALPAMTSIFSWKSPG
jgi:hypothetical protein